MMRQQPSQLTKNKLLSKTPKLEQFFAAVVLGRASADCKHLGICKIESVSTEQVFQDLANPSRCGKIIYALVSYQIDVFLELAFLQTTLDAETRKRHFDQGVFLVEEDYTVQTTRMASPFQIKASVYPIVLSDTLLIVRFV